MALLLQYTLIYASVLLLVALGGCFSERSGIINLGLEGIMVAGALGGALVMKYMPNLSPAAMVIGVVSYLEWYSHFFLQWQPSTLMQTRLW